MSIDAARATYAAALKAVGQGVSIMQSHGSAEVSTRNLRVGINAAMIEVGALASLLISKGLITELEYMQQCAKLAVAEKVDYERRIKDRLGREVSL